MSTILSKLNNAEEQRQQQPNNTFQPNRFIEADDTQKKPLKLILLVLLLIAIIVVAAFYWFGQSSSPQLTNKKSTSVQTPTKKKVQGEPIANSVLGEAFQLEGVLFVSGEPTLSKAIVNGKLLKQGDSVQSNVTIESIGADWVVLNIKGNKVTLR